MIICAGLATRDTIYAVPRHPGADDLVVASERTVAGGGPAATAAVAIARLGGDVRFIGVVDELEGVEVMRVPGRTVESTILVNDEGRSIVTEVPETFTVTAEMLEGADWLHVDHVGYASLEPDCFDAGVRISVDAGHPIPTLDVGRIDLYAPPQERDDGRRAKVTVVTRGGLGCTAYADGETIEVPGFKVAPVSTLGAGDVFHGALVASLDRGLDLREALKRANACAAISCRALDGRSGIPTWDEVEAAVA
ncbi:MAG TPA: PfkB family carbohydrate kinase [Gaiellaceae bacterium]